jgi:hypothetical protein
MLPLWPLFIIMEVGCILCLKPKSSNISMYGAAFLKAFIEIEHSIGSGYNQIDKNQKTDLRLQ